MTYRLTSASFQQGGSIPKRHSCEGDDLSPPLAWEGAPDGTRGFALICEDPDAPGGVFRHWAVFDISADRHSLSQGLAPIATTPEGFRQAVNDFGRPGYAGPCPPRGHGAHHYHFRLLALDVEQLDVGGSATCAEVADVAAPRAIEETEVVGLFER